MVKIKTGKREMIGGIELTNQESNRAFREKEN